VNVAHLLFGTQQDNVDDKRARSRFNQPRGEDHPFAKITEEDVREIRASIGAPKDLAPLYGITVSSFCNIRVGRRWRHI
jgi:hypothetical protein